MVEDSISKVLPKAENPTWATKCCSNVFTH